MRLSDRVGQVLFALLCMTMAASAAAAQDDMPSRPPLPTGADTNDWEPYYDFGAARFRRNRDEAATAFYWASRLDPTRADALYARTVMFWVVNFDRYEKYLNGDEHVVHAADVLANDSLRKRALRRNPFVHQGLGIALLDMLPGRWSDDITARAWLAYAKPDFPEALRDFARIIQKDSVGNAGLRYYRASCFVAQRQTDSARAELRTMLATMSHEQRKRLVMPDESTELVHYGLAVLAFAHNAPDEGEAELNAAIEQNMSFAPAHAWLGQRAAARGDRATAYREFELALEVEPSDAVVRAAYAQALTWGRRTDDAVRQYTRVVHDEPYWADAHLKLAQALEAASKPDQARAEYQFFVAHAPRTAVRDIERAKARIQALTT